MTLAFFEFTAAEILLLVFSFFIIFIPLGYFGKGTALGFAGTILVAVLLTPLTALIIVLILRARQRNKQPADNQYNQQ